MIKEEKLKKISRNLVSNRDDYMVSFRENLYTYLADKEITLNKLAELSDVPVNTLNSLLYGSTRDCRLSTVIKIARVLSVSIDELAGCETMEKEVAEMIALSRKLPVNVQYLIKWFIRHQASLKKMKNKHKTITVMRPKCYNKESFMPIDDFAILNIDNYPDIVKSKVFLGIELRSDNYMPYFTPYDILLIANDREAHEDEFVIVVYFGALFMTHRVEQLENCVRKIYYIHVRDKKIAIPEEDVDEIIGYVVDKFTDVTRSVWSEI